MRTMQGLTDQEKIEFLEETLEGKDKRIKDLSDQLMNQASRNGKLVKDLEEARDFHGVENGHTEYIRGMRDGFQKAYKANYSRIKSLENRNIELQREITKLNLELHPPEPDEDDDIFDDEDDVEDLPAAMSLLKTW